MTANELDELYKELESILVRLFPPEEHGEDSDLSSICTIAQELRDAAKEILEVKKFLDVVEKMRSAQKNYFASRISTREKQECLKDSKQLEQQVDKMILESKNIQPNLF